MGVDGRIRLVILLCDHQLVLEQEDVSVLRRFISFPHLEQVVSVNLSESISVSRVILNIVGVDTFVGSLGDALDQLQGLLHGLGGSSSSRGVLDDLLKEVCILLDSFSNLAEVVGVSLCSGFHLVAQVLENTD